VLPASRVRLTDRGVLRAGAFADLTVFDPDRVGDRADFGDPFQYPVGFLATLVNGVVVVEGGARGERSGRALRA